MDEATDKIITEPSSFNDDEDAEQIRAEIEDTRADMSHTINEIQERLSSDHLMGQVKETVREATIGKVERVMETIGEVTEPAREAIGRAGHEIGNSIWRNPIPIALIGLGVGMLWMKNRRGNGYSYDYDTTRSRTRSQNLSGNQTGQTRYTTGGTGTLDSVKESASDLANRSTQALSDLGSRAKEGANAVGSRFGQMLRENPLAVAAGAVAAGTAVGLILPSTQFESEYIGEASERLVDKAQEVAREAVDKVQDAARQMTQPENNPQQG